MTPRVILRFFMTFNVTSLTQFNGVTQGCVTLIETPTILHIGIN
jgi:hypothetical protein